MRTETKNAYTLSPGELRSLQIVLLEMLVELDRICGKHGIRYGLDAGTLLGAVRHKGFIPWDDDVDLVMLRSEYDKLREACKTDLDVSRFFFQDNTTDPEYRRGFGRLRRLDSEFVRCGQEHLKMRTGIFLDIFPRDNVPDFYPLRVCCTLYCYFWRKVLYSDDGKVNAANAAARFVYSLLNCIPLRAAFAAYGWLAERMNARHTRFVRCYAFPVVAKQRLAHGYQRSWFEEFMTMEFEGKTLSASTQYADYLTFLYGDYMQMPPPELRRRHPCSRFRLPKGFDA